jgi:hypothetical protein
MADTSAVLHMIPSPAKIDIYLDVLWLVSQQPLKHEIIYGLGLQCLLLAYHACLGLHRHE